VQLREKRVVTKSERAAAYNNRVFTPETRRAQDSAGLDFHPSLHVGDVAPDFSIYDLDSDSVRLSDFRGKKHIVFAFGCLTAPIFINDIPDLNRLQNAFCKNDIEIVVIYVREAHAAENYRAHASLEQKLAHARDLQRLESVEVTLLVDTLEGDAHQLYGLRPNAVWAVNKDGRIFYKSTSLIADDLEQVLKHLVRAEAWKAEGLRMRQMYSEAWTELRINPLVHERVLNRAGSSARTEVTHAFGADPVTQGLKKASDS
jgi:peroxiredoxin